VTYYFPGMTPSEFRDLAIKIVGKRPGWQRRLGHKIGVQQATISRYASGVLPIPLVVAVALEALLNPNRHFSKRKET
jgi:hypothetical protein